MVIAVVNDGLYHFLFFLHISAAIVGFGGVVLNGVYGAQAKQRPGPGGLAITEANLFVTTKICEIAIYLVPIFGFGLIGASDSAWEFSQTWVIASLVMYVVALGIAHAVLLPNGKRMVELQREMLAGPPPAGGPPPQVAQMEAAGKKLAAAGMTNNLLLVAILVMMIWKPGL